MEPLQFRLRRGWLCQGRVLLRSYSAQRQITETKLVMLTRDFWNANKYKEFIPRHGFSRALAEVLSRPDAESEVFLHLYFQS
jgi:hypothetical protein